MIACESDDLENFVLQLPSSTGSREPPQSIEIDPTAQYLLRQLDEVSEDLRQELNRIR
jgi:hypothetical protein